MVGTSVNKFMQLWDIFTVQERQRIHKTVGQPLDLTGMGGNR
jgi:hypothetical protein